MDRSSSGTMESGPQPAHEPSGYGHWGYAEALSEFGRPLHLPRSDGWLLQRPIEGSGYRDGMGPYPLFSCRDWPSLKTDLDALDSELVSVVLVAEPFGAYDVELLERTFDRVVHFKDHYVVDLSRPIETFLKRSHKDTVRRALNKVEVRVCERPRDHLDTWFDLFGVLVKRHSIGGFRAFSRESFAKQLEVPGMVMFEALADGDTVGLDLWYLQGDVAYGHLVAFSDLGYSLRASYATKWKILNHFADRARWIDLGGAPGVSNNTQDGLAKYKSGWSTGTKPVYVCGRTLQPERYQELCAARGIGETNYFPAYRDGEFS